MDIHLHLLFRHPALSLFLSVSRALHYSCRGESPTRQSPIAICRYDSTCHIVHRFSLPLPFFLSLIPSLVVYVRLYVLSRVKILAWGRSAGRFAPGDTRRYIFSLVTMHRTSSNQRVSGIHQPINTYVYTHVYICVCVTLVAVMYMTPGVPADIGETDKEKEIPGRYGPSRN